MIFWNAFLLDYNLILYYNMYSHAFCSLIVCLFLFQMNKAGVLRKAIEVIHKLQNDNARLKQENIALKMEQQKRGTFLSKLIELKNFSNTQHSFIKST